MFKPRFTITSKITNALLDIERARGFLDAANLKEAWIRDMQSEALVLEAHHSTHIEGTQLTLPQAHGILAGELVNAVRADDRQELLSELQEGTGLRRRVSGQEIGDHYYTLKLFER